MNGPNLSRRVCGVNALLCFCLIALSAGAANHYVEAGGTGDGSAWNNAYSDLPGGLVRGDTYYIGNGTYGWWLLNDAESGSSAISIKKATVADHGTDTGWNASYANPATLTPGTTFYRGFYNVLGSYATTPSDPTTYGFQYFSTNNQNTTEHFISIGPGGSTLSNLFFSCISGTACTNDVEKMMVYEQTTTSHYNFGFTNIYESGFQAAFFLFGPQGTVIDHCWMTNNSSTSSHHGAVININAGTVGASANITIRYCMMTDSAGGCGVEGNDSGVDQFVCNGLYIYGNVFLNGTGGIGEVGTTTRAAWANVQCVNNTFGTGSAGWFGAATRDSSAYIRNSCTNIVVTNNVIWNMVATINDNTTSGIQHDYNYYAICTSVPTEGHSQVDSNNPFVNSTGLNFHLSGATQAGVTTPYNLDADGTIRGTDGNWDRGAYQPNATVAPPSALHPL